MCYQQIQASLYVSLPSIYQLSLPAFALVSEWAHRRDTTFPLSGRLVGHHRDGLSTALPSGTPSSSPQELMNSHQLEKLDLEPTNKAQYLRMWMDTVWERVYPIDSRIVRFQEVADQFLLHVSPPAKMWQQILGHMISLEQFVPRGRAKMPSLQLQLKSRWSASVDDLVTPAPVSEMFKDSVRWWLQEERRASGVPHQVPPPSFPFSLTCLRMVMGRIYTDLTAAGIWLSVENNLNINIQEMKLVQLSLNAFILRMMGEAVVLMTDSATGVAYLKKHGVQSS